MKCCHLESRIRLVSISKGMGVDAVKVDNIEDLVKYFKHGIKENGPFLIEVLI